MLAERQLDHENKELAADSHKNIVEASERKVDGLVHYSVDVVNDSVPVKAIIDTGSQSTIISCSTLYVVDLYMKLQGHKLLDL